MGLAAQLDGFTGTDTFNLCKILANVHIQKLGANCNVAIDLDSGDDPHC